ncbi:MAG: molybdopterin synthase sulfur carrier subunit [Rhodospirillaceae bacterium]|nr:MAG: molybdopterin synthase sulfur carrier subunit [Rhodospirillaceae bacterium]
MPVSIQIPTLFKQQTEGVSEIDLEPSEASTIHVMLDTLFERYPSLEEKILDKNGKQQRCVNFFVNGLDVRFIKGLESSLSDGDEVMIVPAIAGGIGD